MRCLPPLLLIWSTTNKVHSITGKPACPPGTSDLCALPTEYVGYLSGCLAGCFVGVICFLNFAASKKSEKQKMATVDACESWWIRLTLANLSHCVWATPGFHLCVLAMESRSISLAYLPNDMRQFSTKFGMSNIFEVAVGFGLRSALASRREKYSN